jgi:hypothetical protein
MNIENKLTDKINIGQSVLFYLFNLNSKEIKEKIRDIIGTNYIPNDMVDLGTVTKIYKNDEPWEILIEWYDKIKIDWLGIQYNPENGSPLYIRQFDRYFTLDM